MGEISSPCNTVCILENRICTGCRRTIDEIACWVSMTEEEKMMVLKRLKQ